MWTPDVLLAALGCAVLGGFGIFCLIVGLYRAAEFCEDHTRLMAKILKRLTLSTSVLHSTCLAVGRAPLSPHIIGLCSQLVHWQLLRRFPFIPFEHPLFLAMLGLLVVHQTSWVYTLLRLDVSIVRIISTLGALVWPIPFTFLVSIASGDYALPTYQPSTTPRIHEPGRRLERTSGDDGTANQGSDQSPQGWQGSPLRSALYMKDMGFASFTAHGRRRRGQLLRLMDRLLHKTGPMLPMAEQPQRSGSLSGHIKQKAARD